MENLYFKNIEDFSINYKDIEETYTDITGKVYSSEEIQYIIYRSCSYNFLENIPYIHPYKNDDINRNYAYIHKINKSSFKKIIGQYEDEDNDNDDDDEDNDDDKSKCEDKEDEDYGDDDIDPDKYTDDTVLDNIKTFLLNRKNCEKLIKGDLVELPFQSYKYPVVYIYDGNSIIYLDTENLEIPECFKIPSEFSMEYWNSYLDAYPTTNSLYYDTSHNKDFRLIKNIINIEDSNLLIIKDTKYDYYILVQYEENNYEEKYNNFILEKRCDNFMSAMLSSSHEDFLTDTLFKKICKFIDINRTLIVFN